MKTRFRLHLPPLQKKIFFRAMTVLCIVALIWLVFSPHSGVLAYLKQRSKLKDLQQETIHLQESNKNLENEVDRLRKDPAYLEEVARREHGLLKKNEYLYDFSEQNKKQQK